MASPAAVLSILVKANTGSATTGILRVNQQLGATEKSAGRAERSTNKALSTMTRGADRAAAAFEGVVKALAIGGGVTVAAGLGYAVTKAAEFEQQLSSLGSVADATGRDMQRLRKQALKAGADTKFSALEAAQAQTELAKGGLGVRTILKGGLNGALALAAAGEMDLAEAAATTANALNLFKLGGKDAGHVADVLATAANKTTGDVKDFAIALTQGGGAAKAAGYDIDQTVAFLEALADAGVKGSDAGTSMKTALVHLANPMNKTKELMKQLNLKFFDANGKILGLSDMSVMLRDRLSGMTREQKLATIAQIAGTDGMRGLLAIMDAGPKKLRGYEKGLGKQGTAAEVAKRKQDNLKGSLEQLGGSVETLGIQIGSELLPSIRDAADGLTDFTNKVGRIFARDDLSLGEKFQRAFDLAKVTAAPLVEKLKTAIDQANIPDKLAAVISAATPKILQAAAFGGVAAAKTFVGAFSESSVWGKLALGTFLIRKLGLGGLLTGGLGGKGGGGLGGGASMAKPIPVFVTNPGGVGGGGGGVPGGGTGGKVKGVLKGAGKLGGRLAALDLAINLVDQQGNPIAAAINTAHDLTFGIVPKVNVSTSGEKKDAAVAKVKGELDAALKTGNISQIGAVTEKLHALVADAKDFGDAKLAKQFEDLGNRGSAALDKLIPAQKKVAAMSDTFAGAIKGLRLKGSKDFDGLVGSVTFGARQILKVGGGKSKETREAIAHQFDVARRRVKTAMDDQVISVKTGAGLMHDLAVKELALYGIKAGRVNVVLAKGANGQLRPNQRGGYQLGGKPSGDSIPSLLERGEYVVNRNAVQKVGKQALDRLNFGQAPRFQKGGAVGFQSGGSVTGDTDFLPAVMTALRRMSAAAGVPIFVQSGRRTVAEQLAQGPSTPGHPVAGPNGPHVRGVAADITPGFSTFGKLAARFGLGFTVMPQEPWHIQLLKGMGAGAGVAAFTGLARPQIQGPASAGLEAAQGALDRILSAANASVAAVASSTANGPESAFTGAGANVSGSGAGLMKAISKARGWNFPDWWALDAAETGHGANLSNPTSTARLRGQFLDMNYGKYGPGSDPGQNPSMGQQIESMAAYISERYGNPTKAWAFHKAHNFYATGGLVGMQKGGTPLGKALHKVRTSKSPKVRSKAIKDLVGKLKGIGLPKSLQRQLSTNSAHANAYGDLADRAGQLTGDAVSPAVLNGKTQAEWLAAQLEALFKWRNAIVRAEEIIRKRRETVAKLIEQARKRLETTRDTIRKAEASKNTLEKQLKQAQKKPKQNARLIKALKAQIHGVDVAQRPRNRVRDALHDKILPALVDKRSALSGARGDLLSNLQDVQGLGAPTGVLRRLPGLGVLGGQIFDVQMTLRDLNAPKASVTDSATDGGESASILADLLRQANLRTAVSEKQFDVFKNAPQFGGGGIVPGSSGQAVPAVVHAGEGVFTREQMAAIGGGGGVKVIVHGDIVSDRRDPVELVIGDRRFNAAVERATRTPARQSARGLPGHGGGGLRG